MADELAAPLRLISWSRIRIMAKLEPLLAHLEASDDEVLARAETHLQTKVSSMVELHSYLLNQVTLLLDHRRAPATAEWLTFLARAQLVNLPLRELLVMILIYLPQITYKAYNNAKYRVAKRSRAAEQQGIWATWRPWRRRCTSMT